LLSKAENDRCDELALAIIPMQYCFPEICGRNPVTMTIMAQVRVNRPYFLLFQYHQLGEAGVEQAKYIFGY
jgi:hypothetical protein